MTDTVEWEREREWEWDRRGKALEEEQAKGSCGRRVTETETETEQRPRALFLLSVFPIHAVAVDKFMAVQPICYVSPLTLARSMPLL